MKTRTALIGLAVVALAAPAVAVAYAQSDDGTVTLQCPEGALTAGEQVTCDVVAVDPPPTTPSSSSTTTTVRPTTTTAPPATTTTAPPSSGAAFTETFSGPLAAAKLTSALWRAQEGEPDNVKPSTIATEAGTLRVEAGQQNYGDAAVRVDQPFDFAGRTGTIQFDATLGAKDGWTRVTLAQDPYPVTSYNDDNAAGQGADRGIDLQFQAFAGCSVVTLRTYANRVETDHDGGLVGCVPTSTTALSHVVVTVSNTTVTVRVGTTTIGNFTGLNLGLSRGYLYLDAHNHATVKYAGQPTWVTHWDNVTFDGPVLPALGVAVGPTFAEGTTITSPVPGVPVGVTGTLLAFNARHGQQDAHPGLMYRLNGGPAHPVTLTRLAGQVGTYMVVVPVDPAELVAGTNTVTWTWTGTTGLPPAIGNVQLLWTGTGGTPPPTSTTTAPPTSSSTTTTIPPATTTTAPPAPTTTAAPPATTTTVPSSGAPFTETFADPAAFAARFDHGYSGEVLAGSLFGDEANDWQADHDGMCGDPNATSRTIHIDPQHPAAGVESQFYPCLPGGDPAKGHVMTSVNTEGYNIAWFSPKQTFTNVHKVCWDQNLTHLGGGKWTQVVFLTPPEYQGQSDLGFTSPEFPNGNGPSTPRGSARYGLKLFAGGAAAWQVPTGDPNGQDWNTLAKDGPSRAETADKAARYTTCVTDTEQGALTWQRTGPDGTVIANGPGQIPNGTIRVVFEDDNYNPDKHYSADHEMARDSSGLYTWHWDNIQITTN